MRSANWSNRQRRQKAARPKRGCAGVRAAESRSCCSRASTALRAYGVRGQQLCGSHSCSPHHLLASCCKQIRRTRMPSPSTTTPTQPQPYPPILTVCPPEVGRVRCARLLVAEEPQVAHCPGHRPRQGCTLCCRSLQRRPHIQRVAAVEGPVPVACWGGGGAKYRGGIECWNMSPFNAQGRSKPSRKPKAPGPASK